MRITNHKISRKYGVDQAIGCTTGPSGVFWAVRTIPVMLGICREMEELCPDAWFLHYQNPTSTVPLALYTASPIKSIGLCHSVDGTARTLAHYIGAPFEETGHWVAGVNHQAWFLRFEWNKKDAYPLIREKMKDPEIYKHDMVRFELMRYFGYFLTESSYHNSEYVPYFRKNPELIKRFAPYTAVDHFANEQVGVEARRTELRKEAYDDAPVQVEPFATLKGKLRYEPCINIINAMETNTSYRFNGNVLNTGLITNLPNRKTKSSVSEANSFCVEVPCLVDNMGIHPCYIGDLPPQCAALNRGRCAGDELA